jgi:signal peptidase II
LIVPLIILLVVLILDQVTKLWAAASLTDDRPVQIIGQFLQFKLVHNTGGALGTNFGSGYFYLISSILIFIIVIYFIYQYRYLKIIAYSMAAIAGGAIGNIADRIRLGKVIDFIDVDFFDINLLGRQIERWWVFNIADAAITVGVVVLLVYILFNKKRTAPQTASESGLAVGDE